MKAQHAQNKGWETFLGLWLGPAIATWSLFRDLSVGLQLTLQEPWGPRLRTEVTWPPEESGV